MVGPLTFMIFIAILVVAVALAGLIGLIVAVRKRNMHLWLGDYYFPGQAAPQRRSDDEPVHVFIAVCDHYEPENGHVSKDIADDRVKRWCREYPQLFSQFVDSRGQVPQQTFFFPQDEYRPEYLDQLKKLCEADFGDVDVHLHHDNDTAESFGEKLDQFRETLFHQHGLLRRDPITNEIVYGFIHGNWSLCNSRPDGRWCGVDHEIPILLKTGCYADFTMPSAPSDTQTQTINSIYYAVDRPGQRKSHNTGVRVRVGGQASDDSLLMIQGPLSLDWQQRKWGLLPRIENGDLHVGRPPSLRRLQLWSQAAVHVVGKPDWRFVKLHTHGCKDGNIDTLLSDETQQFHRELAEHAAVHPQFHYYYVTAWEMAQLVHQAEQGAVAPEFQCDHSTVAVGNE